MSLTYIILICCLSIVFWLISLPIKLRFEHTSEELSIKWAFIKFQLSYGSEGQKIQFHIINRPINLNKKPKKAKKVGPQTDSKKKKKKIKAGLIFELIKSPVNKKLLLLLFTFLKRLVKSIKIKNLKGDFSFDDYYQQGILSGLAYAIPSNEDYGISGNFNGYNNLILTAYLSCWKILYAVFCLLLFFPYIKILMLYLKIKKNL